MTVKTNYYQLLSHLNDLQYKGKLIAVSKGKSVGDIQELIDQQHNDFGESYVQEAEQKWKDYKFLNQNIVLHMIGSIQTNKVKNVIKLFDVIHTLDRPKLATEIDICAKIEGKIMPCFIQVNIGSEVQKAGVAIKDMNNFYQFCSNLQHIKVIGLMGIPPKNEDPIEYFSTLHKLQQEYGLPYLSIGMSQDYEKAILYGATHIRIGTELFGTRTS